jgi:hypothetical protein
MPELTSNSISVDSIEERLYRLLRMQNNIATYAVALGIVGDVLVWAGGCHTRFSDAITEAQVESGESVDETLVLHDKFAVALDYYQQTKDILSAFLQQFKPDKILLASYGINKQTPQTYNGLVEAAESIIETNDRLVAALDPRVISYVKNTSLFSP